MESARNLRDSAPLMNAGLHAIVSCAMRVILRYETAVRMAPRHIGVGGRYFQRTRSDVMMRSFAAHAVAREA